MKAKLAYLTVLTLALVGLSVLLILRAVNASQSVNSIISGLLVALGLGAHAVFSDKSPPTQAVEPPKE